jgi:hypothetical protein
VEIFMRLIVADVRRRTARSWTPLDNAGPYGEASLTLGRRPYRITGVGQAVLTQQLASMRTIAQVGRRRIAAA